MAAARVVDTTVTCAKTLSRDVVMVLCNAHSVKPTDAHCVTNTVWLPLCDAHSVTPTDALSLPCV